MADLKIGLSVESQKAAESIKKLQNEWEQAQKKVEEYKKTFESLEKQIEDTANKIKKDLSNFFGKGNTQAIENAFKELSKTELSPLNKELEQVKTKLAESEKEAKKLKNELNEVLKSQIKQPTEKKEIKQPTESKVIKETQDIKIQLKQTENEAKSIFNNISNFAQSSFSNISKFATAPFRALVNAVNNIGSKIQQVGNRILKLATYTFVFNVINAGFRQIRAAAEDYIGTNQALNSSLARIRGNLITAFQPLWETILPYLIQFIGWIEKATAYISAFMSAIFGKSEQASRNNARQLQAQIQASKDTSSALDKQKKNTDKLKKSTDNTNKSLAKFDQLNVLEQKNSKDNAKTIAPTTSKGSGTSGISFESPKIDTSGIQSFIDKVKEFLAPITTAFKNLYPQIERLGRFTGQAISDFWETFLAPIGTYVVQKTIPNIINSISESLARMDFSKVNNALHGLWEALEPLTEDALKGIVWVLDKFLLPLSEWTVNEILPRFLESLTHVLEIMRPIVETVGEQLQKLYDNFLKPVGEWTGGIITQKLDEINSDLIKIGKWLKDPKNKTALEWISAFIIGLGTVAIGAVLIPALWKLVSATVAWTAALLANPITWVVIGISALIAAIVMLIIHFDDVKAAVISAWDTFKDAINNVWKLLKNLPFVQYILDQIDNIKQVFSGLIDFISGVFTRDWDRAFKGLGNVVIGIFNSIISAINFALKHVKLLVNGALGAFNVLIKGINLIPGVDIPEIKYMDTSKDIIGRIPYLASGAVIPPNSPFLAMLGDQRSGTNIEAPLETIKQAFVEALSENVGYNNSGSYTFVAQLDGRTIFEETVRQNDMYINQAGRSAFA